MPALSEGAEKLLNDTTAALTSLIDDWEIRNSDRQDMSPEAWDFLKKNKYFGLCIPEEYGGLGLSAYDHAEIVARLGTHTLPGALTVMVPNSLGPGELIGHYGTQQQKDYYLPRLANGEDIPCFGLTEPNAGSDAASIQTTGVVFRDEHGTPQIKINGVKRYITISGDVGTLIGLAIKLEDPDNILGKGESPGITCVLVPRTDDETIKIYRHRPMDIPFQNGQIFLNDAVVSADNIIGGPDMAGEGWRMLMECLGIGRSISLPATSAAAGRRTAYATGAYCAIREQFGFPLKDMKGLHHDLAKMAGLTFMIDAARSALALRVDQGERPSIGSAMLKVQATEGLAEIVEAGMRLQGGNAIQQGPRNYMGQTPEAEYVARTVEGDNNMTKSVVIFGQGSKKGHQFLSDEIKAAESGDKKAFRTIFKAHTRDILDNMRAAKKMGRSGLGGTAASFADSGTTDLFRRINRVSAAFNFAANIVMSTLSAGIQFEQPTSMRLGQVYGNMLMAYYSLWYFHKVKNSDEAFRPLVEWVVESKMHESEEMLEDLIKNFPLEDGYKLKVAGKELSVDIKSMLDKNIFPKGRKYQKPSDNLVSQVAASITSPGKVRDWLREGMIVPDDDKNVIRYLEMAFDYIQTTEKPVLEKLQGALDRKAYKKLAASDSKTFIANVTATGLLTPDEVAVLEKAQQYRQKVIEVDYYETKNLRTGIPVNKL